jgi:hypothetical protein
MPVVTDKTACHSSEQVEQKRSPRFFKGVREGEEWGGNSRGNTHGH